MKLATWGNPSPSVTPLDTTDESYQLGQGVRKKKRRKKKKEEGRRRRRGGGGEEENRRRRRRGAGHENLPMLMTE